MRTHAMSHKSQRIYTKYANKKRLCLNSDKFQRTSWIYWEKMKHAFGGGHLFIKNVTLRIQTAPLDKMTIDFCRSQRRLHDSDFILTKNLNIWPKIQKIPQKSRKISENPWIPRIPRWRPRWRPMWRPMWRKTNLSDHEHELEPASTLNAYPGIARSN